MKTDARSIAVIGGGASGALIAAHLLKRGGKTFI
jgi:glycine/D-amino acid oxidase-like deaminating enzyme